MTDIPLAFQWSDWWLPPNYSEHGGAIDSLFIAIFVITTIALVLVQGALLAFLIMYRRDPAKKKAYFIHGNAKVEMVWTIVPAIILAIVGVASIGTWHHYRYGQGEDPNRAQIMVIAEQFQWNVVYPGPDGKLGKYLTFPRPSDPKYRNKSFKQAKTEIGKVMGVDNPLGRADKADNPFGVDDDWSKNAGRAIIVPVDRMVDIHLGSKDVLHSFFLPNFRVKLDAVPGMWGHIFFKPLKQSTVDRAVDDLPFDKPLWIDSFTSSAKYSEDDQAFVVTDPKNPAIKISTLQSLKNIAAARLLAAGNDKPSDAQLKEESQKVKADFKAAGIARLSLIEPFEIVCEELCGQGHGKMRGMLIVVSKEQYLAFVNKTGVTTAAAPADSPGVAASR